MTDLVRVELSGIRIQLPSQSPVMLLREADGAIHVPIWIGPVEAASIASALEGVEPERPMTHDLLVDVIQALGSELVRVTITDVQQAVFFAELHIKTEGGQAEVSCRPSDAIAIATRLGAPLFVSAEVMEQAGIELHDESAEDEIEQFREFLDGLSPQDFAGEEDS